MRVTGQGPEHMHHQCISMMQPAGEQQSYLHPSTLFALLGIPSGHYAWDFFPEFLNFSPISIATLFYLLGRNTFLYPATKCKVPWSQVPSFLFFPLQILSLLNLSHTHGLNEQFLVGHSYMCVFRQDFRSFRPVYSVAYQTIHLRDPVVPHTQHVQNPTHSLLPQVLSSARTPLSEWQHHSSLQKYHVNLDTFHFPNPLI